MAAALLFRCIVLHGSNLTDHPHPFLHFLHYLCRKQFEPLAAVGPVEISNKEMQSWDIPKRTYRIPLPYFTILRLRRSDRKDFSGPKLIQTSRWAETCLLRNSRSAIASQGHPIDLVPKWQPPRPTGLTGAKICAGSSFILIYFGHLGMAHFNVCNDRVCLAHF